MLYQEESYPYASWNMGLTQLADRSTNTQPHIATAAYSIAVIILLSIFFGNIDKLILPGLYLGLLHIKRCLLVTVELV